MLSGQCDPDSLRPGSANWDDEFLLYEPNYRHPVPYLTKDARSFLAQGVGSPPLSEIPDTAPILEGRQSFSGSESLVIDSAVTDKAPNSCLRSREDQQYQEAWTCAISTAATPVGADRCQANDVATIVSYRPQEHTSYRLRRVLFPSQDPRIYPGTRQSSLSSRSLASLVYSSNHLAVSSSSQVTPQRRSRPRAADPRKRSEKKYWCPICGSGFSQSQVLGRHVKDKHESRQSCPQAFCPFTWSRGRPHLYRRHLQTQHPLIALSHVRQMGT